MEGFTKRYRLDRLVWLENFRNVNDAIACENKLKGVALGRLRLSRRIHGGSTSAMTGNSSRSSMIILGRQQR